MIMPLIGSEWCQVCLYILSGISYYFKLFMSNIISFGQFSEIEMQYKIVVYNKILST